MRRPPGRTCATRRSRTCAASNRAHTRVAIDLPACDALQEPMAHPNELDALYAFLAAAVVTALLTPLTMRFARVAGAIDEPRERGLSDRPTPLLGGLAIFAGVLLAGLIWLPAGYSEAHQLWHGVLLAA